MLIVGVRQGKFEFRFEDERFNRTFAPTREGLRQMALALEALGSPDSVMCSSSVDFCHEDGMPVGFNANEFVGVAISLAREDLIESMGDADIAPIVNRVVLDH